MSGDTLGEARRHVALAQGRPVLDAIIRDQMDGIVIAAHNVAGNIVGDDPVTALGGELGLPIGNQRLRLGGEADNQGRALVAL